MNTIEAIPSHLCDFCNEPLKGEYTAYNANDFIYKTIKGTDLVSTGAWHACRTCSKMIDKKDWEGLHCRSVVFLLKNNPYMDRAFADMAIADLHRKFRLALQNRPLIM